MGLRLSTMGAGRFGRIGIGRVEVSPVDGFSIGSVYVQPIPKCYEFGA